MGTVRAMVMMALLPLAGCEQAANVVGGAIRPRKAIADLPYQIKCPLKDSTRKPLPYPMPQP